MKMNKWAYKQLIETDYIPWLHENAPDLFTRSRIEDILTCSVDLFYPPVEVIDDEINGNESTG